MIHLRSLAVAKPRLRLTQKEALRFILKNFRIRPGTRALYKKIFSHADIQGRSFGLERLEDVLEEDPDRINRRFEEQAVRLSTQSLKEALRKAGTRPEDLDFLAVSTCTGYLCPGLAARLIESCGLRRDLRYADVVGMGCGSAIPALEQAHNFLAAHPSSAAAAVSTEICSAAMFSGDSADLVVSNAIFADGSAASVLGNSSGGGRAAFRSFACLTYPEWKEDLRFRTQEGRLRNVLSRKVPSQAAQSVHALTGKILSGEGLRAADVRHWVLHSGGSKVLDEIQKSLRLSDSDLAHSRFVLKRHGNLSSPSVLYALERLLASPHPPKKGEPGLMISFGAGFAAHACLLEF